MVVQTSFQILISIVQCDLNLLYKIEKFLFFFFVCSNNTNREQRNCNLEMKSVLNRLSYQMIILK